MNFLKFWAGIVILAFTTFIAWWGCEHFISQSKYAKIALPIIVDLIMLILFAIFWLDYRKWPWQISWDEWKNIIKEKINNKSQPDKEKWR